MNNNTLSNLYNDFRTLVNQYSYNKNEIISLLNGKANNNHTHSSDDVTDSSSYSNLEISSNSSQSDINAAIDSKIGNVITILLGTGE